MYNEYLEMYVNYFSEEQELRKIAVREPRRLEREREGSHGDRSLFDFDSRGEREDTIIRHFSHGESQRFEGTARPCKRKSPKFVQREL